jgi:hypothetical protein
MTELSENWRIANPPQLAQFLSVGHSKVTGWIHAGELPAANIAASTASRPIFRIARADFQKFWDARAAVPSKLEPAPRRNARTRTTTKSFV